MKLEAFTLGSLVNQTETTLTLMNTMMEKWKKELVFILLARRIVADAGAVNPPQEDEAIRRWVKRNVTYRRDPVGVQILQDPVVTLTQRFGKCTDMAVLAGTLLSALGHRCIALGVVWKGSDLASHAVVKDMLTGLVVDPVADVPAIAWPPSPYSLSHFVQGAA